MQFLISFTIPCPMICGDEHSIDEVLFLNPYTCKTLLALCKSLLSFSKFCGVSFCQLRGNILFTFEARHLGYIYIKSYYSSFQVWLFLAAGRMVTVGDRRRLIHPRKESRNKLGTFMCQDVVAEVTLRWTMLPPVSLSPWIQG